MFLYGKKMDLNYFKDKIFELVNETDSLDINDIDADDRKNTFTVSLQDGSVFELECRQAGFQ